MKITLYDFINNHCECTKRQGKVLYVSNDKVIAEQTPY